MKAQGFQPTKRPTTEKESSSTGKIKPPTRKT